MPYQEHKIKESIANALKDLEMQSDVIDEAAFHMTDWLADLKEWRSFCENPESLSVNEVQDLLMKFLVHVPAHIAAAGKLITGYPVKDIFEVGATSANKK